MTLVGCLVFYVVYQQWFSWLLLLIVVFLPWFSLALSYPAMKKVSVSVHCPAITRLGLPLRTSMRVACRYPAPPVDCRIRLVNSLTGERYVGYPGELVPTEHCGRITITMPRPVVYDYLGLFRRRLPEGRVCTVFVLPKPVPGELPQLGSRKDSAHKPKPGGGAAEHHELRLYRPGDELRHIHWKMTAKTGKLIYREAMEQVKKGYVLTMALSGSPDALDRKLGQLLWTSSALLTQKRPHQIRCLTGRGITAFTVTNENTLEEGLRTLISLPLADTDLPPETEDVFWQQRIGGDDHAR